MESQEKLHWFTTKPRNWHLYNLAKTQEKRLFYKLLYELCQIIPEPQHVNGRPPIKVRDLVFSCGLKMYSNYSARKISSDLHTAEMAGYLDKAPHYNTLNDFLAADVTYDILSKLLTLSAMPLANLEDQFSIDSSGFSTYQFDRWIKARFSKEYEQKRRNFIKGHICIGTRTHIICTCEITQGYASDGRIAPYLLTKLKDNFEPKEISMDKAYSSRRIHQLVESLGAIPFIPFKQNTNPNASSPQIWKTMYKYFKTHEKEFLEKYHRRSNVETVFSMVKTRLGEFLRTKTFTSQRNELMMKFICHNITCLVSEIFENEIHINFKEIVKKYIEPNPMKFLTPDELKRHPNTGKIKFV